SSDLSSCCRCSCGCTSATISRAPAPPVAALLDFASKPDLPVPRPCTASYSNNEQILKGCRLASPVTLPRPARRRRDAYEAAFFAVRAGLRPVAGGLPDRQQLLRPAFGEGHHDR